MTEALVISLAADYLPGEAALSVLRNGMPVNALPQYQREIREREGLDGVARFMNLLRAAAGARSLRYSVGSADTSFAVLTPLSPDFQLASEFRPDSDAARQKFQLSRFACIHREDELLRLESPTGLANLLLSRDAAALVTHFAAPCSLADLIARAPDQPPEQLAGLVQLLFSSGAVAPAGSEDPNLATWEFHDLLFHTRSRSGRAGGTLGGNFRFLGKRAPLPAAAPSPDGEFIELVRPDLNKIAEHEAPLVAVMEQRRSRRAHGVDPITLSQLGEFLYRTARVRRIVEQNVKRGDQTGVITVSDRPYPCGGASHEIDHYLVVARCAGLDAGLYYYDPQRHGLVRRSGLTEPAEQLLRDARRSVGAAADTAFPQVLLIYAARFQRVSWKYEGVAYSLILKHVGVLQQSMYLVAEAMGLAACAIGAGNSDIFARAAGMEYLFCTSVGEFALGSRARAARSDRYAAATSRVVWEEPAPR